MESRDEAECAVTIDRPASERTRDLDDILLRVAAIDPERVELEQLAAVILVEAALLLLAVVRTCRMLGRHRRRRWKPAEESASAKTALIPNLRLLRPHVRQTLR